MQVYQCDICGMILDDPYKSKLRTFTCIYMPHEDIGTLRMEKECETSVDICKSCFKRLFGRKGEKNISRK